MSLDQESELSQAELDSFLGRKETGVLALARQDDPYAIPISYGYDGENQRFYFRLVSTPDSEKRRFLASFPKARLVVYEQDGDTYHSVIAAGVLEDLPREDLTVEHIVQYGGAKRPVFEIWGSAMEHLDVELYRLDSDMLSGRRVEVRQQTA